MLVVPGTTSLTRRMWWQDAVIYQIYPRSFQDSDGDGVGDLQGIEQRLDHLAWLGVDALWLSPIYPSPMHDFGYDVADYKDVDPVFGSLDDFDSLVAAARERGLRVLSTSCRATRRSSTRGSASIRTGTSGRTRPNNWTAAFGGPAWSPLDGRYYLHSFYPEQPDLDWRNPEVVAAMQHALRFWIERGIAGYRVDAIDRLLKDAQLRDDPPATEPFGLPLRADEGKFAQTNSRNAPDTGQALARIREAVGDALLVGEVYLPSAKWQPYLEHLDAAFAFELLHAPWDADQLRAAIEANNGAGPARRGCSRTTTSAARDPLRGGERARGGAAAAHAAGAGLPLPGRRDRARATAPVASGCTTALAATASGTRCSGTHSPSGGFSAGEAWLPPVDPERTNVEDQRDDPLSTLSLVRDLLTLRRVLGDGFELLDAEPGVLAYRRGDHLIAINTTSEEARAPLGDELVLETAPGAWSKGRSRRHSGVITRSDEGVGHPMRGR